MDIYEIENSSGCIVSVGGQLPQNIALKLHQQGVKVLGTSPEDVDKAEDREKFSSILDKISVDQPEWRELKTVTEALEFAEKVSYPVLVRPSYVLSGAAMNVAHTQTDLENYLSLATDVSPDHPIVITKFIQGAQELDVDAVADKGKLLIYAVSQHVENAGVHSGDATLVLPPIYEDETPASSWKGKSVGLQGISPEIVQDSKKIAEKVAKAFNITGPFNMQIILSHNPGSRDNHTLKVIECNLRGTVVIFNIQASRSFPFVSKVLDINFIDVATRALVGDSKLPEILPKNDLMTVYRSYKCVKNPIFSWTRLSGADPLLGVEMASTGEVACFGRDLNEAFFTSLFSNHNNFSQLPMTPGSAVLISADNLSQSDEVAYVASELLKLGYKIVVDDSLTASILEKEEVSNFDLFSEFSLVDLLKNRPETKRLFETFKIEMMFSFCRIRPREQDSKYLIRRTNIDLGLGFINDSKVAVLYVDALKQYVNRDRHKKDAVKPAADWLNLKLE